MSTRAYSSSLREAQARETRERILRAAGVVFARKGFGGATLAAIGEEAGVSTESVKLVGSKQHLLLASFELVFRGDEGHGSVGAIESVQSAMAERGPEFLSSVIEFLTAVNARVSGLWIVVLAAAAGDEVVRSALDDLLARRSADFALLVGELADRGLVLSPAPRDELAGILSFLLSPEGYEQLVVQTGWTLDRYRSWLVSAVSRELSA